MTKKIVGGQKDENGIFVPAAPKPVPVETETEVTLDELLKDGLTTIRRILKACLSETKEGMPERDTVMNLKDCMSMIHELRKKEQDLLDGLSDEDLEKYLNE